ncbi:hypothetical protein CTI12_AA307520 [Artemisia annua]|uniref:DUF4378 domain-containing protein n=1 Tax=Artemisia annua TaxID=35608 RepID=A0A2U1N503_ARTAN|nr:hypothetical protein CTI12_AA307520 [Artemisia annua]
MAARASFSSDARMVRIPLPKSVLLKDYLLDDLSSCSSNGFRSYPRRQCCTKVRYLIEIDLNKHIKLHPSQKKLLKNRSKKKHKPKSSVLHKASNAVVNVFKSFQLSKRGFWKKTSDQSDKEFKRLDTFKEPVKQKIDIVSNGKSNSSLSSESYFTATSDSSGTGGYLEINLAQADKVTTTTTNTPNGKKATTTTTTTGTNEKTKKDGESEKKEQFSPVSVMDFPYDKDNDEEDEVTSPFQPSHLYIEGSKPKLMPKVHRIKSLARIKPVRLENRITLSESRAHDQQEFSSEENQTEKKVAALLQLLKATMPSQDLFESTMTESVLLSFFTEQVIDGNVSNYEILQEAKDWLNGQTKETFESENYKPAYIKYMEKGATWTNYNQQIGKEEVGLELENEVLASLVEEMLLDFLL